VINTGVVAILLSGWAGAGDGSNLLDRPIPAVFEDRNEPLCVDPSVPPVFEDQEENEREDAPMALRRFDRAAPERDGSILLGVQTGFLKARGADRGSAYGGIHGRVRLSDHFAGEGSIGVHESAFARGDLRVIQIPLQGTLFFYPIAEGPFRPYLQAGVGFYYTKTEFRGALEHLPNRPENIFGQHVGIGVEIELAPSITLDASLKYVFQNATIFSLERNALDYWQFTVGFSCSF
jgi:hypothetical protein